MPRASIFQTNAARATVTAAQLSEFVGFLVRHHEVALSAAEARALTGARALTATPISAVFTRAVEQYKDRAFAFVKIPARTASVPEVVTYRHVTFDVRQMATVDEHLARALAPTPFADKIIHNVTPLVNALGEPADLLGFQAGVVRDLLSRSYFTGDRTWISPAAAQYLTKVHSMAVATALAGVYSLDWPQSQTVATVFAYHYLQKMTDAASAEGLLQTGWRQMQLPQPQEIADVLDLIKSELGDAHRAMTLDDACRVVRRLGVTRLMTVVPQILHARLKSAGPDILTSAMALEYPPYLAYCVLLARSGAKIGLSFTLKKNGLEQGAATFADDLLRAPGFWGAL